MFLTKISIKKPLMMIMVIAAVVIFGLNAWRQMPVDMMPEMDLPYVTVQCLYIGAGPEEIENTVVKPLEEQFTTISGLKNISSYCMESVGFVVLEFNSDVDADLAAIEVKDKYDQVVNQLPTDLLRPVIGKFDPNTQPIVDLALTGPAAPEKLREMAERDIKEQLVRITGVGTITLTGGREREIQVNLRQEKLQAHNLSIFMVFPVIGAQSANFPAGRITGISREYTVRVQGEFESLDDIRNLSIPTPMGYSVKLYEIAEVTDSYEEVREEAKFNGKTSVNLALVKRPDANTVDVADQVLAEVEKINAGLPAGFKVEVARDRSEFIKNAVHDTYSTILIGILLTAGILLVFLFDLNLMLIAAVTMPVSLVMALVGMNWMGFSLNIVSLMALSISVGILVTNSIVVLENIVRFRDNGFSAFDAAEKGTTEIVVAVLASALTNLAVFIPIASMSGIIGNVFKALGLTIVFATIASLFLSFTLTPLMASRMLKKKKESGPNVVDRFIDGLRSAYTGILERLLGKTGGKVLVLALTLGALFGSLLLIAPKIGSEFFPASDMGYVTVDVELPPGTPLTRTDRVMAAVEERILKLDGVSSVSTSVGGSGTNTGVNYGQSVVKLVPADERDISTKGFEAVVRPLLTDFPDAVLIVREMQTMGGPSSSDIDVEVTGIDMDKILALTDSVKAKMDRVGGLADINMSWKGAQPEIQIIPDRDRLEHYGLTGNIQASTTIQALGGILRFSMTGNDQAVYREDNEDYPIRVQLDVKDRDSYKEIADMPLMMGMKGFVPVKAIARVVEGDGISSINRKNRQRMVNVTANVTGGSVGGKAAALGREFKTITLEDGYGIGFGGNQDMQTEMFEELIFAGLLAIVLTVMVLVGILESFVMAFVIWLTLPLGIIGVVLALGLTGNTFNMMSNMSIIMLIGIVVNNAILMIDYARQHRREHGSDAKTAIIAASGTKLKAIIMMNLAIILAMLPQALAIGSGGEMRAPFAITAIGGIIVSTLMTLFVIPVLYVITAPKKVKGDFEKTDR